MGTRGIFGVALLLSLSCAGGGSSDGTTMATFGSSAGEGEGEAGESEAGETSAGTAGTSTTGDGGTTGDGDGCGACDTPPGECYEATGSCISGTCEYDTKIAGSTCEGVGVCDAMGTCIGGGGDCNKPHATGTTTGGSCGNWVCDAGWGDCNNDIDTDGCEVNTDTEVADCGACGNNCNGDNLSATCTAGTCDRVCTGDYENCDGDWANGCEIPTGVPQMCDQSGIRTDGEGCWTAYCGANAGAAGEFGTYHCVHCANCNVPTAGNCRWCDSGSGNYFPEEVGCACGAFEDLVCSP